MKLTPAMLDDLRQRLPRYKKSDSQTRAVDWSEHEARLVLDYLDTLVAERPAGENQP